MMTRLQRPVRLLCEWYLPFARVLSTTCAFSLQTDWLSIHNRRNPCSSRLSDKTLVGKNKSISKWERFASLQKSIREAWQAVSGRSIHD
jgi:hypothetical protein